MNRDQVAGRWKQFRGNVQEQWSRFVGDESGVSAAKLAQLAGSNQVRRGRSNGEAERQLREFLRRNRNWNPSKR